MSDALTIEMPLGLPGVTDLVGFTVQRREPGSAYAWLRAADDAALSLLTVDVLQVAPDYPMAQIRRSLGFLHLPPEEPLWLLALCTVPAAPDPATANLLAPIGVGTVSLRGAQIVLHDSRWSDHAALPG